MSNSKLTAPHLGMPKQATALSSRRFPTFAQLMKRHGLVSLVSRGIPSGPDLIWLVV